MATLDKLSVLVTRPKPHGEQLCELIRVKQGNPIYLPTIEIVPIANTVKLQQQIAELDTYHIVIFISQHAVEQSMALIKNKWPAFPKHTQIAAVGASTAKALESEKLSISFCPATDWSSEGLLALPELQEVAGKRVAIVCGENGRDVLAETLRQRGAHVDNLIAYQRMMPKIANLPEYANLFKAQKIDIIVCTSGTSLLHLLEMMGEEIKPLLHKVALIVVSERLIALAEELKFKHVFLADDASHDGIVRALETIQNMLGKVYAGQERGK